MALIDEQQRDLQKISLLFIGKSYPLLFLFLYTLRDDKFEISQVKELNVVLPTGKKKEQFCDFERFSAENVDMSL